MKKIYSLWMLCFMSPCIPAVANSSVDIATCQFQSQSNGNIKLDFRIYRSADNLIVEVVQNHPAYNSETIIYRQVKETSYEDRITYLNNFDFELIVFPSRVGYFTGKIYGIAYKNIEIICKSSD